MKNLLIILLAIVPLLASCSKKTEAPAAVVDISQPEIVMPLDPVTPVPDISIEEYAQSTPAPEYGTNAEVTVVQTASHLFKDGDSLVLYGAAEYTNSGDCPVTITSAVFTFTAGSEVAHEFIPVLNQYDVVLPGQTSYVTLWLPYEGQASEASDVTMSASLTCERTDKPRIELELDNLYLADNYPGFTTLSGTIRSLSSTECSLNLAFAAFYDESDSLLGVWHFTKNASLAYGDEKNFVVHMTELPIEALAEKTDSVRSAAFGFN